MQLPIQSTILAFQLADGAAEMKTAHYPRMAQMHLRSNRDGPKMRVSGETAARFFGPFNFLTASETRDSTCYALLWRPLCFCRPCGTASAYGRFMLQNSENRSTQNDAPTQVIRADEFKAEVLESKLPVLVEFWAAWSKPCQVLDPVVQDVAAQYAGKIKHVKVNADDSLDLSLWYDIQSVPTLLYFVQGTPRLRLVGTASKEAILAKLKPFSE